MPLYVGSTRSKKSRKDGANRKSSASVVSTLSHATKGSRSSLEKHKKESAPTQPAAGKTSATASGYPQTTKAPMDSKPKSAGSDRKSAPNVFEYLEEDDSDSEISSDDDHHLASTFNAQAKSAYPGPGRQAIPTSQGGTGRSRASSMRSKGSMDSSTLYGLSPTTAPLQLARNNRKFSMDGAYSTISSLAEGPNHPGKRNSDLTTMPEAYYPPPRNSASFHRPPLPPSPPQSPEEDIHQTRRKSRKSNKSSHTPSGYGLLSWKLSSADSKEPGLPPLYRRFENINHRVLLHLQDEIAQIEEELRVLDEYDEIHRLSTAEQEGTKMLPASRRMDVQAQVYSSLHYRREEAMAALIHKTQQYNTALSAYNKVLQTLPGASDQEVHTYRAWMKENSPIAAAEMRFLDHAKDLVSLTPRAGPSPPTTPVYSAIVIASAAILLPLLAFGMISEFSGRLLIVAVVGGAASAIASNYSTGAEQLVDSKDGWRCATVYFGFMTMAAMFIP